MLVAVRVHARTLNDGAHAVTVASWPMTSTKSRRQVWQVRGNALTPCRSTVSMPMPSR